MAKRTNYVKSVEVWTVRKDRKATERVQVSKIAVRVAKGTVGPKGQRAGTFGGATNLPSIHVSPR